MKMSGTVIKSQYHEERILPRCLSVYNRVQIILGLLNNDSNLLVVLRLSDCGYLLDRSTDWGKNKQLKVSGPWALSLPDL